MTIHDVTSESKYTRPTTGVPASDMTPEVQDELQRGSTAALQVELIQLRTFYDTPDYPVFRKSPLNPILTSAQIGLGSIYTSCLVRVPDEIYAVTPQYGRWRLYASTDHDGGAGGIVLIYSNPNQDINNPMAPGVTWTVQKDGAGATVKFTVDSAVGRQVETPFVIWDTASKRFFMYYQVLEVSGLQETWVAASDDAITWTPAQVAMPTPTAGSGVIGNDHTGYARIFNMDGLLVGWHLHGGGPYGGYGYSYSMDGINWVRDRRRMAHNLQMGDGVLRGQISAIFEFRGRPWALLTLTEFVSGAQTSAQVPKAIAPLSDDLRSLIGSPYYFPNPPQAHELTSPGSVGNLAKDPTTGKLYGCYRTNGSDGELNLLEVSV